MKKNEEKHVGKVNERRKEGKTSIAISTHYFLFVGTSFDFPTTFVHQTIKTYVGLVKNIMLTLDGGFREG